MEAKKNSVTEDDDAVVFKAKSPVNMPVGLATAQPTDWKAIVHQYETLYKYVSMLTAA